MKISVITAYTLNYKIGNYTKKINENYCKINGYDFVSYNETPDMIKNRHPAWFKIFYLIKRLNENIDDYVMDRCKDAFFCNNILKIEKWINETTEDKEFFICRDAGYSYSSYKKNPEALLNSGVMIFKNTDFIKKYLNNILINQIYKPNYNKIKKLNKKTKTIGWDQAAIRHTCMSNIYNIKEKLHIIENLNFNNNCLNPKLYIQNGGYIIHLTNFSGKFKNKKIDTIKKYNNILNHD